MAKGSEGSVRIISGKWRGRKLPVVSVEGLRPTGNRIRETLFNWLQPVIHGARCLDVFAGSGALGFEAASRGASDVVLLDTNIRVIRTLKDNCDVLKSDNISVIQTDAVLWMSRSDRVFDIVFIDPPFASELYEPVITQLIQSGLLAPQAYVYIESNKYQHVDNPTDWQLLHEKSASGVTYRLYQKQSQQDAK